MKEKRRQWTCIYWSGCALLAISGTLYWMLVWKDRIWTNDAYVQGNQVYVTPLHSGFVTAIHTDDSYLVQKNSLLIELDRTDALIALEKAKEELAYTVREVCEMMHQVFADRARIDVIQSQWIRDAQDFEHRLHVVSAQAVSLEEYEHAVAALRESYHLLRQNESRYEQALALVQGVSIAAHPKIKAAADRVREAWVYLRRCQLYAPATGLAAQRLIQVGMWVKEGEPLLSVVPMDQIWVNANFKETQMRRMRLGQKAKVTVDLYGKSIVYHGTVVGLPGAAGNVTSLLPPQNLSGNWIKIVQRLPVRIELDLEEVRRYPLRLGLSSEVTIDVSDETGPYLPSSSRGSPTYQTDIYREEEAGDVALIERMITVNLDPNLLDYRDNPLELEEVHMRIPASIREALQLDLADPLEPPFLHQHKMGRLP